MPRWTTDDIPDQTGCSALVTGTGGLGFEVARELARKGGDVIIAGRNHTKGETAVARIKAETPGARIGFGEVDLANLASVAAFAQKLAGERRSLDLLVANAGVMMPRKRQVTADGFELQFGTNHLGHFALVAHLLQLLRASTAPRIVSVSSIAHRRGRLNFDDLQMERAYASVGAYAQSKLAVLMFALELQRRSDAGGWGLMSNAAHPGFARTDLIANGPGRFGLMGLVTRAIATVLSQSVAAGAEPILYAATDPNAEGGGYYGPDGWQEMTGATKAAEIRPQALDRTAAEKLWQESERLTGVAFA